MADQIEVPLAQALFVAVPEAEILRLTGNAVWRELFVEQLGYCPTLNPVKHPPASQP